MIHFVKNQACRRTVGRLFVFIGITLCAVGQTVGAQTRFALRDTTPDLSKYANVEDCVSGLRRTLQEEYIQVTDWADTIELGANFRFSPGSKTGEAFASQCIAKFNAESVDVADSYLFWIELYMAAGKIKDGEIVAKRMLSGLSWNPTGSETSLGTGLNNVIAAFSRARPYPTDLISSLIESYIDGPNRPSSIKELVRLYTTRTRFQLISNDSSAAKLSAQTIVSLIDGYSGDSIDAEYIRRDAPSDLALARELLADNQILDSLRVSGQAYARARRSIWKDVSGLSQINRDANIVHDRVKMIGEKAAPLVGQYVYPRNGNVSSSAASASRNVSDVSYPSPGKINIVAFLYGGCRKETPILIGKVRAHHKALDCLAAYTILKRIAKQYPEVELTVVTRTKGYLGMEGPLSPDVEVDMIKKWWIDNHKLPASLVIAETDYFRMPSSEDRRRIDVPDVNAENYIFLSEQKREKDIENKTFYLVDADGTILEADLINIYTERSLKPILDIITKRNK